MEEEQRRLLKRISELSSAINKKQRVSQRSRNKTYVAPPAVAAASHVIPVVAAEATPEPPARRQRRNRHFSGARPSPISVPANKPKNKNKKKKKRQQASRTVVFREDGAYRKMSQNVLQRSSGAGNKTLVVPKPVQKPVCKFFLRGECFKEDCEFSHVFVGDAAEPCEQFQRSGFCELGDQCPKKHQTRRAASVAKSIPAKSNGNDSNSDSDDDIVQKIELNSSFIKL